MQKISQWLLESIDSHEIASYIPLAKNFEEETGLKAEGWPTHTIAATRELIAGDVRGGNVNGDANELCVYGYEMAAFFAKKHAGHSSTMMGRGFLYRDCLDALRKADF